MIKYIIMLFLYINIGQGLANGLERHKPMDTMSRVAIITLWPQAITQLIVMNSIGRQSKD